MCFDARTSVLSFILGSILSLSVMTYGIVTKHRSLAILSGGWIWVIFMQWWEYMIWSNYEKHLAIQLAYIFNIMQIPLLYFLFVWMSSVSNVNKFIATFIIFIYLCTMFYPNHTTDVQQTNHLEYSWWVNKWKVFMYFFGLATIFLLLVRPLLWSICCVVTLFVLLGVSILIYGSTCIPSLWCFFAVFFPILALLYAIVLPS